MKKTNLITRILVAATAVVIFSFSCFSFYINDIQRRVTTTSIEANIQSSGEQAVHSLANWMNGRVALTEMIGKAVERVAGREQILSLMNNEARTSRFSATYFGDEQGTFTMSPDLPMPADYDARKRPWYSDAVKADSAILTEPYVDASSGALIISAAVPVKRDGKVAGVVGSDFALDVMVNLIRAINLGGQGTAFLVNSNGQVLIHPDAKLVTKSLSDVFPTDTPTIGYTLVERELNGSPVLVRFMAVDGLPTVKWYLGFIVDSQKAFSALQEFRVAATVATLLSAGLMIAAMAWLLHGLVIKPVTAMTADATACRWRSERDHSRQRQN